MMEWNEVRKLVKLVESSQIQEVEIERDGTRIRICKSVPQQAAPPQPYAAPPVPAPVQTTNLPVNPGLPVAAPPAGTEAAPVEPVEAVKQSYHEVKSPMVGTFYRSPAPDADPYTETGDVVKSGQTLCIIEAMKLMNEIESDVAGRIVEILVENGQPVEFNQPMFLVDTKA